MSMPREQITYIKHSLIHPSRLNPRTTINPVALEELRETIKSKGLLQPLRVKSCSCSQIPQPHYEIVIGERRWRAAQGILEELPCIVEGDIGELEHIERTLIENLQREEVDWIQLGKCFKYLKERYHLSDKRLAQMLGVDGATVWRSIKLLDLCEEVQKLIDTQRISRHPGLRTSKGLLSVKMASYIATYARDPELQKELARRIIQHKLAENQVRYLYRLLKKGVDLDKAFEEALKIAPAATLKVFDDLVYRFAIVEKDGKKRWVSILGRDLKRFLLGVAG